MAGRGAPQTFCGLSSHFQHPRAAARQFITRVYNIQSKCTIQPAMPCALAGWPIRWLGPPKRRLRVPIPPPRPYDCHGIRTPRTITPEGRAVIVIESSSSGERSSLRFLQRRPFALRSHRATLQQDHAWPAHPFSMSTTARQVLVLLK